MFYQGRGYISRKLARSFLVPFRKNTLRIQRGKLLLDPILELKIQSCFLIFVLISQNGTCLTWVMIAVVTEKNDFAADLLLQTAGGRNFSEQESFGKKSAGLLAETNNRMIHGPKRASYAGGSFRAAKESLLHDWRKNQYGRAPDKVIPEITDARRREQDQDQHLCDKPRKENCRSCNSTNEEGCQEKTENGAIQDRAQNV